MIQLIKTSNYSSLIQDFLEHLFVERGLSNNTISSYKSDLEQFKEFLVSNKTILFTEVSQENISQFVKNLAYLLLTMR